MSTKYLKMFKRKLKKIQAEMSEIESNKTHYISVEKYRLAILEKKIQYEATKLLMARLDNESEQVIEDIKKEIVADEHEKNLLTASLTIGFGNVNVKK